jgi:hypothetical protein
MENESSAVDRRLFLGAGAATLLAAAGPADAQHSGAAPPPKPAAEARPLSDLIAEFVTGFNLEAVPPLALERAHSPSSTPSA